MKSQIACGILVIMLLTFKVHLSTAQTNFKKSKPDYSKEIKGIFILDNTECAGFEFTARELIWRNESACMSPDTFLIYWTDTKSFMAKEKKPAYGKPSRAPLIWFYTIIAFDGHRLVVENLETGWGPFKTGKQTFRKVSQ